MANVRRWRIEFLLFTVLFSNTLYAAECEFIINNEWNAGFTSTVKITNSSQQDIDGWTVGLNFSDGSTINNIWNANISGSNPYDASDKGYNAKIRVGQSVQFGFNTKKATSGTPATTPVLSGICADSGANQLPNANARASLLSGQVPLNVGFDGSASRDPEGSQLTYLWTFMPGESSTEISPSFTFDEAGTYSVSLVVNDGEQNSLPSELVINVFDPLSGDARCEFEIANEWQSGFTGKVTLYNDTSAVIDGWIASLTFPDNTSVSGAWNSSVSGNNPFNFNNANYNGKIQPGSSQSFGFNAQKGTSGLPVAAPELGGICGATVVANNPPTAVATASPQTGVVPFTVTFDGSASNDPDGDPLTYSWQSEQGSETRSTFAREFTQGGTFEYTLTVNDGELDSDIATVTVVASEPQSGQAYSLDAARSSLHFVSTKKTHVIETHTFTQLSGAISDQGEATLSIDLNSIESGIDIRNERMREHLFKVATFTNAEVNLSVDLSAISAMESGDSITQAISPDVNLHGITVNMGVDVRVTKLTDSTMLVQNLTPININAADFAMTDGIEQLRSLAGLDVISYAVPVNFTLVFVAQ